MSDIQTKLFEERLLRSIRARRRFKAIVRDVINNMLWLLDDEQTEELNLKNIRRNVTILTRRQKTNKTITIKEKSLLRKAAEFRTVEEKRHLHKFIGDLKCFRKYPAAVKYALVGVTYFEFYESGRVIMKQNHPAHAMYFLLSGEVNITLRTFDEVEQKWVTIELGKKKAGSIFGEVSLLNSIPRTATVTTCTPCELLCLRKEEFDNVLKDTIKKQWDEIMEAMSIFPYFDYLDNSARTECCVISKIKEYQQDQTILGDGYGLNKSNMVYFIIEGKCSVLESLMVIEGIKNGIKYYKLFDLEEFLATDAVIDNSTPKADENNSEINSQKKKNTDRRVSTNSEDIRLREKKASEDRDAFANRPIRLTACMDNPDELKSILKPVGSKTFKCRTVSDLEIKRKVSKPTDSGTSQLHASKSDCFSIDSDERIRQDNKSGASFNSMDSDHEAPPRYSSYGKKLTAEEKRRTLSWNHNVPPEVKTHFIQICVLNEKAHFKDSSRLKNRRVVALTKVKCLLIPQYWLLQHNRANIWNRIDQFLDLRKPSTKAIFDLFVKQKKWLQYRRTIREEILSKHKFPNNTTIYDVPYSIRIKEPIDDY